MKLQKKHTMIYPIAARCGVFAKTDIQPLINEGAAIEDLAASIFQAVVNQTISGTGLRSYDQRQSCVPGRTALIPVRTEKAVYRNAGACG